MNENEWSLEVATLPGFVKAVSNLLSYLLSLVPEQFLGILTMLARTEVLWTLIELHHARLASSMLIAAARFE